MYDATKHSCFNLRQRFRQGDIDTFEKVLRSLVEVNSIPI